ncbi:leucine-rich repeat protein [Anaerocolumna xylanovorans]|uniref:Leucine rich repeat-containing protein n=1 Tax=Anaerocolumna xylanovorans DSM 12503 TaxID=1121345 RepID=A0A1M7YCM3_9FIRM|nr:leucine-rich repeat protein [Anaerocolumna xylanovorans]SHO50384.1 Leucine rich repeat-containing protein [Anaerocolumna xylanovorans DSM 12503]
MKLKRLFYHVILLSILSFVLLLPVGISAKNEDFVIKNGTLKKYQGNSKNVVIPDTVTSIGVNAFYGKSKIVSISIPKSVKTIDNGAFANCSSLIKITIPDSVIRLGGGAFSGCKSLEQIKLPVSIVEINSHTFAECGSLKDITIPGKVASIGDYAFQSCTALKKIKIPNSVTSIGSYAFSNCDKLADIALSQKLKEIKEGAFYKTAWYKVQSKKGAMLICNGILFDAMKSKGKVTVPKGVTEIGYRAFANSSVTEVILPKGVKKLGREALSVRTLSKVTLPDGLIEIGDSAFSQTKLESIKIPESVTLIDFHAFSHCSSLKSVTIPEGVKEIGGWAFASCISLREISFSKTVTSIGINVLDSDAAMEKVEFSSENPVYTYENGFLLSKDKKVLLNCLNTAGDIKVPEGVEDTAEGIFDYMEISSITFPSTMKYIKNNLFEDCSRLTYIKIPSSLLSYGKQIRYGGRSLTGIEVYTANNITNYSSADGVLYNADKTILICEPSMDNVTVADYVTTISDYAFPNAKASVTIPQTVTFISDEAFDIYSIARTENETPFYIYGYTGSAVEEYWKKHKDLFMAYGIQFLAYDGIYTISYNLDGGTNNTANPTACTHNSGEIVLKEPTKEGYLHL